jgi:alkylation response protein AidB-like acyl-CoA dehydrogenase
MNLLRPPLLNTERDTLDRYIPGLDKYLSEIPLLELEQPGNGALAKFRELGGPALLVPAEYEGRGASLLDAVRIQRAVGSRSPSLAVATTMHHFSVASLVELTAAGNGFEWAMLMAIAENNWLLSSGFAEGKPGQHILTPAMRGVPADGGITVSGVKKPCSLTWSMNLLSASVAVTDPATGTDRLAVVLIPAESPGIDRAPFWGTTALAAAESDQVRLNQVFVPDALVFYPQDGESMDPVQARGFVWFELLVSASYLGAATNLAERVIGRGRGTDEDRVGLAVELETAAAALEQVASVAATADDNDALLARALFARFGTERAVERAAMAAAATLGGMAFIESPEIAYLLGAVRALAFHPPSRAATAAPLARYLAGGPLVLLRVTADVRRACRAERALGEGARGVHRALYRVRPVQVAQVGEREQRLGADRHGEVAPELGEGGRAEPVRRRSQRGVDEAEAVPGPPHGDRGPGDRAGDHRADRALVGEHAVKQQPRRVADPFDRVRAARERSERLTRVRPGALVGLEQEGDQVGEVPVGGGLGDKRGLRDRRHRDLSAGPGQLMNRLHDSGAGTRLLVHPGSHAPIVPVRARPRQVLSHHERELA